MFNSARNVKKKIQLQLAVFGGRGSSAAVSSQFLNKHQESNSNLTAVNHFLAVFMRFKEWFQKVAHPPPPFHMAVYFDILLPYPNLKL